MTRWPTVCMTISTVCVDGGDMLLPINIVVERDLRFRVPILSMKWYFYTMIFWVKQ